MNKSISIIVILILVAGGLLIFKDRSMAPTEGEINNNMPVPGSNADEMIVEVEEEVIKTSPINVREFSIDATTFSFSPKTMTVNSGDTVKITVKNLKGIHDLKIDEFNAATRTLQAGEQEIITFVADKTGSFEYYCSVGNHRAMGMTGMLTVI